MAPALAPALARAKARRDRRGQARGAGGASGLFALLPLPLGGGIGLWFSLPSDPGGGLLALAAAGLLLALAGLAARSFARQSPFPLGAAWQALGSGRVLGPLLWMLALAALGFLAAEARSRSLAAPILGFRYYGPVEGRVIAIDRSQDDRMRLLLDHPRLGRLEPRALPARLRLSLQGAAEGFAAQPGDWVMTTAHLGPPPGPAAPGSFDFRRLAWFDGLGAVGYTRVPVLRIAPPESARSPPKGLGARLSAQIAYGLGLGAQRARVWASGVIQAGIPGQPGAFAAALMTGDRAGIDAATNQAMRDSNLSHMISISGLHMGMLAGFVFAAMRMGLALIPALALRIHAKKAAAVVALLASTLYLWLAGPNVATQRAYVMAAVVLLAVLLDRRGLSLQTLALAALLLLLAMPESLVEPGFQMSFGATLALILVWGPWQKARARLPGPLRPAAGLAVSSLAAGLATAPIAAAHFNRVAEYGLLANMLTVPIMGAIVMPAGVIWAILAPFGLGGPALWAMGLGCRWILLVAHEVAGLAGATFALPSPPAWVLPLMGLGALLALLLGGQGGGAAPNRAHRAWLSWRGALRLSGLALVLIAAAGWALTPRPLLLVAPEAALVGLLGPEGRALSRDKGGSFAAASWLEDDGDLADQARAAARPGFSGPQGQRKARYQGHDIWHLTGKAGQAVLAQACQPGALVVFAPPSETRDTATRATANGATANGATALRGLGRAPPCQLILARDLARQGGIALSPPKTPGGAWQVQRAFGGDRAWGAAGARAQAPP